MGESSRSSRSLFLLLPAVLGAAVSLLWSLRYDDAGALRHDASRYYSMACELTDGRFGPLMGRQDGLFLDPGYPLVLAAWLRTLGKSINAAQLLNALLWGTSAAMLAAIVRRWVPGRRWLVVAAVAAVSPMLTSFAPKLYSEHLAIAGLLLAVLSWVRIEERRSRASAILSLVSFGAGVAAAIVTRAAFFPLAILLVAAFLVMRRRLIAAVAAATVVLAAPLHLEVQRGGRFLMAAAHQAAMVERWPTSVALRCGVYSLSWNLGRRVFPEVEGACEPFVLDDRKPGSELNARRWSRRLLEQGFTLSELVQTAVSRPGKYLLICGTNLAGAAWIEGFYPQPLEGLPKAVRQVLWGFKVVLSMALWTLAVLGVRQAVRDGAWRLAAPLAIPAAYMLAFQANVLGEQRYYFPLIPLLYALASLNWGTTAVRGECYDTDRPPAGGRPSRI